MSKLEDDAVLVRGLDVTARLTETVAAISKQADGGILLETLIGRYVLSSDARPVWLSIDGRRTVTELVAEVAEKTGHPVADVRQPVLDLCGQLLDLRLVEVVSPADAAGIALMSAAG
ncbi:PqqD family protein [Catellatospora methionotrophica]|uniref:PqqD family protein n=1 Tax=Catellatospora methionotrophica TaxID=121620 RepID=UPI0033ED4B57